MQSWIEWVLNWVENHQTLITVITISSIIIFIGTLVFIPWLIIRLPRDYFANPDHDHYNLFGDHPLAVLIVNIARNIIGSGLILVGILLLVLPGQGLLTIILGFLLTRFPGKQKFVYWLVKKNNVHRSINWIRRKANKPDIVLATAKQD